MCSRATISAWATTARSPPTAAPGGSSPSDYCWGRPCWCTILFLVPVACAERAAWGQVCNLLRRRRRTTSGSQHPPYNIPSTAHLVHEWLELVSHGRDRGTVRTL